MDIELHFLKTAGSPSLMVRKGEHTILFDAPLGIRIPYEPNAIFLTDRSEALSKSAAVTADVYGVPLMGAGRIDGTDFSVEPFKIVGTPHYGYMIKSENVNIAYAPVFKSFPHEILGADVAILDGSDPNVFTMIAKSKSPSRVFIVKRKKRKKDEYAKGEFVHAGQVLHLITKNQPEVTQEQAQYREPSSTAAGMCNGCRFFEPYDGETPVTMRKKAPDVTENEIRIRVRPPTDFEADSFRTKVLDESQGISSIIGKPRGKESTAVQSFRFERDKWSSDEAAKWVEVHKSEEYTGDDMYFAGTCTKVIGDINPWFTCDLFEPNNLVGFEKFEMSKSVRQAFGSPGGKRALAKKIVGMIPEHKTYVEPYAGGAAVLFSKDASTKEVINDMDAEIVHAYKTMQSIDDVGIRKVQGMNWTVNKNHFNKLKKAAATGPLLRFYSFLYMRGAAYGNYTQPSASHEGKVMKVASRLPAIRDRIKDVLVLNAEALDVIKKFDSSDAFFYLDPPYPTEWKFDGNTGKANANEWSGKDMHALIEVLKSVRGKFILSLEKEVEGLIPKNMFVKTIPAPRQMSLGPKGKLTTDTEILVSNFELADVKKSQPDLSDTHVDGLLKDLIIKYEPLVEDGDGEYGVIAKSEEQQLVWTVNMVPNKVDNEGHWQTAETIMKTAHNFLIKDLPIWSEHQEEIKGAKVVQSYTLLSDLVVEKKAGGSRTIPQGSWISTLWITDTEEWAKVKRSEYRGTSVRGFARKRPGSPPASERQDTAPVG